MMHFDSRGMVCCTLSLARRYVVDYPRDGFGWLLLGISLCAVARYTEALSALRAASRLCPPTQVHLVRNNFGRLYQQKGNFRRAETWFRRAIQSSPLDATSYIYLGALLGLEGRLMESEAVHRRATLCEGGCIDEAFFNLGLVLRAQEKYPEAIACFQKALAIDPTYKLAIKELADMSKAMESIHIA